MTILRPFKGPLHFELYLLALAVNEAFDHYLNYRQLRVIGHQSGSANFGKSDDEAAKEAEKAVKVYLENPEYPKTVEYARDKLVFGIVSSLIQLVISVLLLLGLYGPRVWKFAGELIKEKNEYKQSLIFCGIKVLVDAVVELPFGLYSDFVIEERHGFNKKTVFLFFKDLFISLALQIVIGGPILCALIFLVGWGGETFYLYTFAFVAVVIFVMHAIYPDVIAPLFNKYEPLKDGELKTAIEQLASSLKYPLKEIKVVDGSKRSSHSNMYLYGFWRFKKIVIYDTLLQQPKEQILAITAHELGHWKCNHTLRLLAFSYANIFAMFYAFRAFKDDKGMFESFGFKGVNAFVIGISLFGCIYTPIGVVMHILSNTLTRKGEYEADAFAVKLGYGDQLAQALVQLCQKNKSLLLHDRLYSWFHFTHPVLYERLYAIFKTQKQLKTN